MRHSNLTNLNKIQKKKKKKESIEGSSSHIIGDEFNVTGENTMKIVLIYKQNLNKWHKLIDESTKKKKEREKINKFNQTNSKNHRGEGFSSSDIFTDIHEIFRELSNSWAGR